MGIEEMIMLAMAAYNMFQKISATVEASTEYTEADKEKFRAGIEAAKETPQEW